MSYPYSKYLRKGDSETPLLLYTVGSNGFNLQNQQSDVDLLHVELDILHRMDISKTPTRLSAKYSYTEGVFEKGHCPVEVDYMELGTFLHAVGSGSNLKAVEAAWMVPTCSNVPADLSNALFEFLHRPRFQYIDMYWSEVNRRYRKVFFREINEKAKNFNQDAGFDTKEAAHLLRVMYGAFRYVQNSRVKVDYSDLRVDLWAIRTGKVAYKDLFEHIKSLLSQLEVLTDIAKETNKFPKDERTAQELYNEFVFQALQNGGVRGRL